MKKYVLKFLMLLSFVLLLVSCGGTKGSKDSFGCYMTLEDAQAAARKSNKDVVLFITLEGDDLLSEKFITDFMGDKNFSSLKKLYEVAHFDLSGKARDLTKAKEGASDDEIKKAKEYLEIYNKQFAVASLINVKSAPAIYRFTKNGLYISEVVYDEGEFTVDNVTEWIARYDYSSNELSTKLQEAKKGTPAEQAKNLNALFSSFSETQKKFPDAIIDEILAVDKENESGLAGSYFLLRQDLKASKCCAVKDYKGASDAYIKALESPFLTSDDKLDIYFMSAYLLGMTQRVEDIPQILEWIDAAKALNPDADHLATLNSMYEYFADALPAETENNSENAE